MDEQIVITENEQKTIDCHLEYLKITHDDIAKVWRHEGVLCVAYKNGKWW